MIDPKNNSSNEYNVYCDESCHLENDHQSVMLLGGVWCLKSDAKQLAQEIHKIKMKYCARGELKWTKVSKSKQAFYFALLDYFFKTTQLHFRCLVVHDKSKLDHDYFNQGSHDTFYYKMYYSMLKAVLSPQNKYHIYLDIKDNRSQNKVNLLKDVLCNNFYDFTRQMIKKIQHIHSYESELMQLADLLIGAVSYRNRHLSESQAKLSIINYIEREISHSLLSSTPLCEEKFNLFIFSPTEVNQ